MKQETPPIEQVKQTLRRLRNKVPLRFHFHYLRTSWLEWFAIGFTIDFHAVYFGLRIGKILIDVNDLAGMRFRQQANAKILEDWPMPIQVVPHMPPGGAAMVATGERLGHYNVRERRVVIEHPERIIAIRIDDKKGD